MLKMAILPRRNIWRLTVVAIGLWHATLTNNTHSVQSFDKDFKHRKSDTFVLSINITQSSLYGEDKHLSPSSGMSTQAVDTLARNQPELLLPVTLLKDNSYNDEIHNDVLYEINKNNQEHTKTRNRLTSAAVTGEVADSSSSSTPSPSYFERVEWQESQQPAGRKDKLLLHRHKRYLLFPEGSSFQLVFDLIIPIVDYTNFAIMGITCAVAWELPSKPASELIDNIRHKLNDGTLGISRRNDTVQQQLQYINAPETIATLADEWENSNNNNNNRRPQNQLSSAAESAATSGSASLLQQTPPRNAYYPNSLQQPQITNKATSTSTSNAMPTPTHLYDHQPEGGSNPEESSYSWSMGRTSQSRHETNPSASWQQNDNWWQLNKDRIQSQWQQNQWKWQTIPSSQRSGRRNRKLLSKRPKHHIYPVFGKRRRRSIQYSNHPPTDDLTHKLNEIHIKQHLDTRHTLYAKIEKLYKTRGHNGTACVLRTLCETHKLQRKRRLNPIPNTFVMELLRVIFTLPSDDAFAIKAMDTPYIAAMLHANYIQSCSHLYDGCELPIWQNVDI